MTGDDSRWSLRDSVEHYCLPADLPCLDARRRRTAALNGARWLIAQRARTPLRRLYRTAGDPEVVREIDGVRELWATPPRSRRFDPLVRGWRPLTSALGSLLRVRAHGGDIGADVDAVRHWFEQDLVRDWRPDPIRRLVCLHLLHALGAASRQAYERQAGAIRAADPPAEAAEYRKYLIGIVHVLFCDSGYLRRRLDRDSYARELAILGQGLEHYLAHGMDSFEADTAAELIIGLRLCAVEHDERVATMQAWLTGMQQRDGGWHPVDWPVSRRTHRTSVTAQALIDWADEPRWILDMDY